MNGAALLNASVYPDGVETEMASGYDMGTAYDFFASLQLIEVHYRSLELELVRKWCGELEGHADAEVRAGAP